MRGCARRCTASTTTWSSSTASSSSPPAGRASLDAHTYFIDYEGGYVYIAVNPKGHLIEITAHDSALVRTIRPVHGKVSDKKGPAIRGITFTQYAYRALEVEGIEPDGPADPVDLRQGRRRHDAGERDDHLLLAGGRRTCGATAWSCATPSSATRARRASTSSARPTCCSSATSSDETTSRGSRATTRPR